MSGIAGPVIRAQGISKRSNEKKIISTDRSFSLISEYKGLKKKEININ